MAALANIYTKVVEKGNRTLSGANPAVQKLAGSSLAGSGDAAPETTRQRSVAPGLAILRPFANEDIYFYMKRIDNAGVVRAADPQARRHDWKAIAGAGAVSLGVIGMLLGGAYGLLAGYKIDGLEKDHLKLETERGELQLESQRVMPIEKMNELAHKQFVTDPALQKMVYLDHAMDDDPQAPAVASLKAPASAEPVPAKR